MFSNERINKLFIQACASGQLPLVKEIYQDFYVRPNSLLRKFASFLFIWDDPTPRLNPNAYQNHAFLEACYKGHNDVLIFLLSKLKFINNLRKSNALSDGFSISLKIGNIGMADIILPMIKHVEKNPSDFLDHLADGFEYCCKNGKVNSVKFVLDKLPSTLIKLKVNTSEYGISLATFGFVKACELGQVNVINAFSTQIDVLEKTNVMLGLSAAIECGQVNTVKYLLNHNVLKHYAKLEKMIITKVSSLDMMHYLMYELNLKDNKKIMNRFNFDLPTHLAEKVQINNELSKELLPKEDNQNIKEKKKLKV